MFTAPKLRRLTVCWRTLYHSSGSLEMSRSWLYDADLHLSHLFVACPVAQVRRGEKKKEGQTNVKTRSQCRHSSDNCQHALCAMKGRAGVRWSQGLAVTRRASHPGWGRWRRWEERKTGWERERAQEIRMTLQQLSLWPSPWLMRLGQPCNCLHKVAIINGLLLCAM